MPKQLIESTCKDCGCTIATDTDGAGRECLPDGPMCDRCKAKWKQAMEIRISIARQG